MSKDFGNAGSHEEIKFVYRYYGVVEFIPVVMSFVKGLPPSEYVVGVHPANSRADCVRIVFTPVPEMIADGINPPKIKEYKTGTREWIRISLESIETLTGKTGNAAILDLDLKPTCMELVPDGKKYVKDGEERDQLHPKFIAVFDSEESASDAYVIYKGAEPETESAPQVDQEREMALKFLSAMVAAGIDVKPQFGTNPVLSCLKWEDEEVQKIVKK